MGKDNSRKMDGDHLESKLKNQRINAAKKQNQNVRYKIYIAVVIVIAVLFYFGTRPPQVDANDSYVKISGLYGVELRVEDIQTLELSDSLPRILARTNGMDLFGFARRGIYELEGLGRTRLFSFSNSGPYICMHTGNEWIVINFKDIAATENLYQKLEQAVPGE